MLWSEWEVLQATYLTEASRAVPWVSSLLFHPKERICLLLKVMFVCSGSSAKVEPALPFSSHSYLETFSKQMRTYQRVVSPTRRYREEPQRRITP